MTPTGRYVQKTNGKSANNEKKNHEYYWPTNGFCFSWVRYH